jgi:hypothetical protein
LTRAGNARALDWRGAVLASDEIAGGPFCL